MSNRETKITVICNQKGGVGKSTTAAALGAYLYRLGLRVLLVDFDPQANLTLSTVGAEELSGSAATLYEALQGEAKAEDLIIAGENGPDIIPADSGLSLADMNLSETGREFRLKKVLEKVSRSYDHVIIDAPPTLGILTINALTAADMVVVPIQADIYSLQGLSQLYKTFTAVKEYTNPGLSLRGIFFTRYNARTRLGRELEETFTKAAEQYETKLFNTRIRECIALREAALQRQDIYSYAPKSNAAEDYSSLGAEIYSKPR